MIRVETNKKVKKTYTYSEKNIKDLTNEATRLGVHISEILRDIVNDYFDKR